MTGADGILPVVICCPAKTAATIAIGHGKKPPRYIDGYLSGAPYIKPDKHQTASFKNCTCGTKRDAPQKEQDKLEPEVAVKKFWRDQPGPHRKERFEAQRCLSCGNCFECDGCFGACPEDAIIKLGKGNRYKFNYDACTGCAVCFEQCPCHAIEMIPEPVNAVTNVK